MPGWIISVLSIAFIGAVVSSLDSLLNMTSIALVRTKEPGEKASESITPLINLKKASILIIVLAAIIIALFSNNIVDVFVAAVSFVMVIAAPILHILFDNVPDKKGAFYSIVIGSILLLTLWFFIPKYAFVPASVIGWIIYFGFVLSKKRSR